MNCWIFTGNLVRDPETRDVGEHKVTSFTVAVRAGFGDRETTTFVNVNAWDGRGKIVSMYAKRGSKVVVSGELSTRDFTAKDGSTKKSVEVRADSVEVYNKDSGTTPATPEDRGVKAKARPIETNAPADDDLSDLNDDDELPF